jgi:hypothetical protein
MPEGTVIWDFEQHGGDSYWTKRLAPIYRGWKGPIWGINEKNIPALRDAGVTYDRIVRLGYAPELVQTAKRPTVQSADVFFGGSLNPRRIALFDEFRRRGIRLDIGNGGVWGGPLWDRIFSAKLVINPHFFSHPKFEQLRVVPLLANAIPVVSEDGDPEGESRFFDGICVAPYAKLADAVQALLSDDTARLELGARGQEIVRGLPMTAELSFLSEGQ